MKKSLILLLIFFLYAYFTWAQQVKDRKGPVNLPPLEVQKPIEKPKPKTTKILSTTPENNTRSSEKNFSITAKVANIKNESEVQLKLEKRGIISPQKTQSESDGIKFIWSVELDEGMNNLEIIAKSGDQQDTKKLIVEYQKMISPPEIVINYPAQNPFSTSSGIISLEAFVKYVKSRSDVTLKLGGRILNVTLKESYEKDGMKLSWENISLLEGDNDFQIIAKNESKEMVNDFKVIYHKPKPPQITIVSPTEIPYKSNTSTIRIISDIKNVKSEDDVILKDRNKKVIKATKREETSDGIKLTWQLDIEVGQNDLEITAFNAVGENDIKKLRIFYEETSVIPTIWAVIVGISEYQNPNYKLQFASKDAEAFNGFLIELLGNRYSKDRVTLLLDKDATRENIIKELEDKTLKAEQNDLVIVYFACHGTTPIKNTVYFLCYDTKPGKEISTALMDESIRSLLVNSMANKKIWIADACHSGGVDPTAPKERGENLTVKYLLEIASQSGFTVLTASKSGESSFEHQKWGGGHGVFTYYLIKGLKGEADTDKNGKITLDELTDYVKENVRKDTDYKQTPQLKGDGDIIISVVK
jgi:hypothetical protein